MYVEKRLLGFEGNVAVGGEGVVDVLGGIIVSEVPLFLLFLQLLFVGSNDVKRRLPRGVIGLALLSMAMVPMPFLVLTLVWWENVCQGTADAVRRDGSVRTEDEI